MKKFFFCYCNIEHSTTVETLEKLMLQRPLLRPGTED